MPSVTGKMVLFVAMLFDGYPNYFFLKKAGGYTNYFC